MKDDDGGDALAWLAIVLLGLILLLTAGILAAVVGTLLGWLANEARKRYLSGLAEERFAETIRSKGLTIPPDQALQMLFAGGIEFPENGGVDEFDLVAGASLGMGMRR